MSNGNDWGDGNGGDGGGNDWGQPQQPASPAQPAAPAQPAQPAQQPPMGGDPNAMVQQNAAPTKIKHQLTGNDIVPLILSFFLPGSGHIMLGQTTKGIVILAAVILTCGAGYALNLAIVADAYFVAMCKKDREIGDWEFFPDYNRYI